MISVICLKSKELFEWFNSLFLLFTQYFDQHILTLSLIICNPYNKKDFASSLFLQLWKKGNVLAKICEQQKKKRKSIIRNSSLNMNGPFQFERQHMSSVFSFELLFSLLTTNSCLIFYCFRNIFYDYFTFLIRKINVKSKGKGQEILVIRKAHLYNFSMLYVMIW